ncbi:glutamyl-tRNA reductase [Formosa sp. Hel3_A1_48]|jgi:glutamyl-tRNA reductase|uniref:glutamyl-tRNA reductase n=1 Tax=Formosa sp. Hel3_A1_48 TaxID=1336795 RepID=UPI00084E14F8|nr:glutamyl-tRNA reductase [Formosa sp. Hel3_A1_48]AOR26439.1 glutamyl-tRNA reductase [Formosa sp. Hel3_A1_48]MDC0950131.1 glutamyl-tRNA reductase [Flavobacteriaceae bacterium]MDG1673560.1 glutamyl-tRNA reductase [Flavobacteriaceae bacterium]MDG2483558.1 glutamyl-tRNA reductase [Flavobacteriaceae bacterium]
MEQLGSTKKTSFYVIGISYKKADAKLRGDFSLSPTKKARLLNQAKTSGIQSIVATSTCNRTEIYAFVNDPNELVQLLCNNTVGTIEALEPVAYTLKDSLAIEHMFRVGAGLDSQILGDFEIISQLKSSARVSKKYGLLDAFLERLINSVIQASKRIKTETKLSSGATSVSFASVQYILKSVKDVTTKNILLFGTGKIGRNTCENLIKHTKNEHITLINRTRDRAEKIAGKFKVLVKDYSQLPEEIKNTDILIVATGAQNPTVDKQLIQNKKELLILDLSLPKNVDENVKDLKNVTLTHLDELSNITDETLNKRKEFIPVAEAIIEEIKNAFLAWLEYRKFAPTIKALKEKLNVFAEAEIDVQRKKLEDFNKTQADLISAQIVQKITNHFAHHLKQEASSGKKSLELIQEIFQLDS